eukprot:15475535-Alexandrium_andersonii.AAC.1
MAILRTCAAGWATSSFLTASVRAIGTRMMAPTLRLRSRLSGSSGSSVTSARRTVAGFRTG